MNTNLVGQDMALRAMGAPKSYIEHQLEIWKRRRNLIFEGLQSLGLDLWKPEGAFYVFPHITNPRKFVEKLYLEYKTISYLGDWFGAPDRVRLSYAIEEEQILRGLDRISRCLKDIE